MPGFLWPMPHASFLCADFAPYPFTVINHNHEYGYILSPSESQKLRVIVGTLTHGFLIPFRNYFPLVKIIGIRKGTYGLN